MSSGKLAFILPNRVIHSPCQICVCVCVCVCVYVVCVCVCVGGMGENNKQTEGRLALFNNNVSISEKTAQTECKVKKPELSVTWNLTYFP